MHLYARAQNKTFHFPAETSVGTSTIWAHILLKQDNDYLFSLSQFSVNSKARWKAIYWNWLL